ncbi:MAG TPA: molybdopterin dehydrogenase [Chloroflexi bacterium]|nr:molybdopterin dehydrogenase [Chloroflexota bacterium]
MKPPSFRYLRPTTVEEAVAVLAEHGSDAKVLAGGQSLIPMMNLRMAQPRVLVDINRLAALDYIRPENGTLVIGALTRQTTLERSSAAAERAPLMVEAVHYVAHRPIRNRGTVGGSLAHADPAAELPAIAVALDGSLVVRGAKGERTISAPDFFVSYFTTSMEPDELLTEVRLPVWPAGQGWSFKEFSPRQGDFALAGVAATLRVEEGVCQEARLVYIGVDEHPLRITQAEEALTGRQANEGTFREAAAVASRLVDPPSDVHADVEYRRDLVNTLTRRALMQALERCEKGA